jgi:AcrR family transcriptional regulator
MSPPVPHVSCPLLAPIRPEAGGGAASPAPSHQRRKAERPQELIAAALDLFVEKGFAATRTEEVAQRAGVSKGTLYLYYPSKEELLKAVIAHYLGSEITEGERVAREHTGSAADALRGLMVGWWQRLFDSPASGVFKLIVTEVRNFPEIAEFYHREVIAPGERVIGSLLARGMASGEFRTLDLVSTVHSIVLPMVMLCLVKHSVGACRPEPLMLQPHAFIQQHMDLLIRGLQADAPGGPPGQGGPAEVAA